MTVNLERVAELRAQVAALPNDMTLSQWLSTMRLLQEVAYDAHYDDMDPETKGNSILMNLFAMVCEVVEMGDEMGWKTWTTTRGWVNELPAIKEAVDWMHFGGNLLAHAKCDGGVLGAQLKTKMLRNLDRQLQGYDGRSTKCPDCRRDLGEYMPAEGRGGLPYNCNCGALLLLRDKDIVRRKPIAPFTEESTPGQYPGSGVGNILHTGRESHPPTDAEVQGEALLHEHGDNHA